MHNYKSKAEHWKNKLMRTSANSMSLATYRFKKWKDYEALAIKDAMNHLRGEDDAHVQQSNH